MAEAKWSVEVADTSDLTSSDLRGIRRLMDDAFGSRLSGEDWDHALGGRHFVVRDPEGVIVSHASVVRRTLEVSGRPFATGYVEAVATHPRLRRRGLATVVMGATADFIRRRYELGALSSSTDFYEKIGWLRWRGPTWCRDGAWILRTVDEDGGVFVLPTQASADLDIGGDIVADWREGDVW